MNQPTRQEFEELKEEVRKLREQQTEPMNISDTVLIQTIMTMVGQQATNVGVLQHEMAGARADITAIRESQADQRDQIKEIKDTMATKDDIAALKATQDEQGTKLDLILKLLQKGE